MFGATRQSRHWLPWPVLAAVFAVTTAAPPAALPQESRTPAVQSDTRRDTPREPNRERRKRIVQLAGYLLLLLALSGLLLVTVIVLWGFRARRVVRKPLPQVSPVDELWYLRPKQPKPADRPDEDPRQP